ncbi:MULTISPECIES: flavin reductase family protein [unclassified Hyphomicrobium]|uniref:flavin reductase family protein n=1 Tax=unclassified Hyphomicrobium TaxID=2619925 RepID=UPI000213F899|nr:MULTISPECIES: flavin reductase family protein [unclassified Hyphomicrobium]CCB63496.1 Actinorhodin polyketide dimerase [Hyphomicrobium sp. MC1]
MDSWSAPFSPRDLRDAFGLFPTGVAVITANSANSERLGLTVSSFNSVSVDPPLVQFSIAKTAKSLPAWEAVSDFAVNILAEHQSEISTRFAKALSDKWEGVHSVAATMIDAHLIHDVLAAMECKVWARYDGGDHIILLGEVVHFLKTKKERPRPLVFANGRYRKLDSGEVIETPYDVSHLLHGW